MIFDCSPVRSIPQMLQNQASTRPDKVFIRFGDRAITYQETAEAVAGLSEAFLARGVGQGTRVAVYMDNSPEMVFVWFATAAIGAIFVPTNTNFLGDFLQTHLEATRAETLVLDGALLPPLAAVAGRLPTLTEVIVNGEPQGQVGGRDLVDLATLLSPSTRALPDIPEMSDPATIMFTSGTTGRSKGVVLSHHFLLRQAEQMWRSRDAGEDDVVYTSFPMYHLNAMVMAVLGPLIGGAQGCLDTAFSVSTFWDRVRHYGATQLSMMGSMITMLMNRDPQPDDYQPQVKCCAAAPIPPDLRQPFTDRFGPRFVTVYGMSEATPLALSGMADPEPPLGTSGKVNPLFDVRIFDTEDREVPPGTPGQIVCRPLEAHIMFEGYADNPEATVAATRNFWFHTGDLGSIDAGGYLTFVGRRKDALRRRGENISAYELEEAMRKHPKIAEVAVHAVPSEFSEDEIKACVIASPGADLSYREIVEFCLEHVPYFAVPRYFEFLDEFPRNMSNRVTKYVLEERGITAATWDREAEGIIVRRPKRSASA